MDRVDSYVLRPARSDDVGMLVQVARRSWLSAFEGSAPESFIARWRAHDREPAWYAKYWRWMTVAERQGEVVGLVQPMDDEVNGLWVDPAAQGMGVGCTLLRVAEDQMRMAGFASAWLTCSGFNRRALDFYRRRGYTETRRIPVALTDDLIDDTIIMERSLTPPITSNLK